MHHVGIVYITSNLIDEVGGEVKSLVAAVEVEASGEVRLGTADDVDVVRGDVVVAVEILELSHAGEGFLPLGQLIGVATGVARSGVIGDAGLQGPYAIDHIEVVDGIDACALQTLDKSHGLVDLHEIVIIRYAHGGSPACVGTRHDAFHQLVDIVLVVVDGSTETQVEVLGTDNLIVQGQLDTLVGGLADVLILIAETGGGVARHTHQDILGGVPVDIQGTAQFTIPETEVETDVTGDGGLPLQVGITQTVGGNIGGDGLAIDGGRACFPECIKQSGVDAVVTRGTVRDTELQVVQPLAGSLHEGLVGDAPGSCCCREITPLVVATELGRAVGTQGGGQEVAVHEVVVGTSEPGNGMGGCAYVAADGIARNAAARHGYIGEDIVHIPLSGIAGADDLAAVRLAAEDFVAQHDVQLVLVAETCHVVAQRGVPAGVVAVAIGQRGVVVALAVGLTTVPTLGLAPVTTQIELGLTHQTGDDLPGEGVVDAHAITVAGVAIVIQDGHGVVVFLGIGTAHTQIGSIA